MECVEYTKETLKQAIDILKQGGVIAHPADTCFGLAADLKNPDALKRLKEIKIRDSDKPMSIMIPVFMKPEINKYAKLDEFANFVCKKLLPGPVTILLPKGPEIPDYFFPNSPYIGLRIPYDIMTEDILMAFKGPLITTSANLSDEPSCSTCKEVQEIFKDKQNKPDLIFQEAVRNVCKPSTVILIEDGKIKITREGPMKKDQLEGILGVKVQDLEIT
jgi:L-threonylcarbamoyladenylate synthase